MGDVFVQSRDHFGSTKSPLSCLKIFPIILVFNKRSGICLLIMSW